MAKRPSFQIYPADWQSNSNLKRCTFEEKGVWIELIFLLHDSDEYGIIRWTLEEIALALRCDIKIVQSLVKKGVLKGTDKDTVKDGDKVSLSDTFAQRQGSPITVTLIDAQVGPIWYSSRMVRDEYIRKKRADCGRLALDNPNVPQKKIKNTFDKDGAKDGDKDTLSGTFACSTSSSSSTVIKKIDKPKGLSKKESLWPSDFLPNETHIKLATQGDLNLPIQLEKFKDWHLSKGTKFKDWNAALRTWLRNAIDFNNKVKPQSKRRETATERMSRMCSINNEIDNMDNYDGITIDSEKYQSDIDKKALPNF